MKIEPVKKIATYDKTTGEQNGELIILFEDGRKTLSYLNIIYPGAFKGYHIHTERTNRIFCLEGEVIIYTKVDEGIIATPLNATSMDKIIIPPDIPTAIENIGLYKAMLLFQPDPPFDPANKGEQLTVAREEIERLGR